MVILLSIEGRHGSKNREQTKLHPPGVVSPGEIIPDPTGLVPHLASLTSLPAVQQPLTPLVLNFLSQSPAHAIAFAWRQEQGRGRGDVT